MKLRVLARQFAFGSATIRRFEVDVTFPAHGTEWFGLCHVKFVNLGTPGLVARETGRTGSVDRPRLWGVDPRFNLFRPPLLPGSGIDRRNHQPQSDHPRVLYPEMAVLQLPPPSHLPPGRTTHFSLFSFSFSAVDHLLFFCSKSSFSRYSFSSLSSSVKRLLLHLLFSVNKHTN